LEPDIIGTKGQGTFKTHNNLAAYFFLFMSDYVLIEEMSFTFLRKKFVPHGGIIEKVKILNSGCSHGATL
jgi:hypothetical protein